MQGVVLQLLLINVVPAVLELPPRQRIAFDRCSSFQQLQMRSLSSVVPSPSIDHDIALQSLQRSVEGLNLQCIISLQSLVLLQRIWCTMDLGNLLHLECLQWHLPMHLPMPCEDYHKKHQETRAIRHSSFSRTVVHAYI